MASYPDGNITYTLVKVTNNSGRRVVPAFGWKLMTNNQKKLKSSGFIQSYKFCLGVYCCQHCSFTQAPKIPVKKQASTQHQPKKPKGYCPIHSSIELVHHPCDCKMHITEGANQWTVTHFGNHNHPRPPWSGRLNDSALIELKRIIHTAPELTPLQLRTRSSTRKAAREIHPSLNNHHKLAYERKKLGASQVSQKSKSSYVNLINYARGKNHKLIRKSNIAGEYPHLIFQDDDMQEMMKVPTGPFQTDSIEGFVEEASLEEKQINLTITSMFDILLQRWVPICISILFGKSEGDYRQHWEQVFSCIDGDNWEAFDKNFIGNTSDMSDAIRNAFYSKYKNIAKTKFGKDLTEEDILKKYKFFMVHFKRSQLRVANNHAVVHPDKRKDFDNQVALLLNETNFNSFQHHCHSLMKAFSYCKNWLK